MHPIKSIQARFQTLCSKHYHLTRQGRRLAALKDSHKGERCFIIGNGPSLTAQDLQQLHDLNVVTFATNRVFKIFDKTDWRPTYYVSEDILLMRDAQQIIRDMPVQRRFIPVNLKWYEGVDIPNANYFYMEYQDPMQETFCLSTDVSRRIRCRGTVTMTCLQLAVYMGFSQIYLIGVDHNFAKMFDKNGNLVVNHTIKNHFADDYDKGIFDQGFRVDEATEAYMDMERLSRKSGSFRVFNATRGGKLEVYERVDLDSLINQLKMED